jgi:hypothetical protein
MEEEKEHEIPVKKTKWRKTVKVSLGVLGGLSLLAGYISATGMSQSEGESAARKTVNDFFASLNARDEEAVRKSLNYPHVQIYGTEMRISNAPEDFHLGLEELIEDEGWHHDSLDSCVNRQNYEDKVYFEIRFSRYRSDSSPYATYQSFWIVTCKDGHWGIQCQSNSAL